MTTAYATRHLRADDAACYADDLAELLAPVEIDEDHQNPYFDAYRRANAAFTQALSHHRGSRTSLPLLYTPQFTVRDKLTRVYSWAIPTIHVIRHLADFGPIVEMGAGTGYWSRMLANAGCDVVALDQAPPNQAPNHYCAPQTWFPVQKGGPRALQDHASRTLLLCWPPYAEPFAAECLENYHGKRLIYVGESQGGCTGDDRFFELLDSEWDIEEEIDIPQFETLHDYVTVFTKK